MPKQMTKIPKIRIIVFQILSFLFFMLSPRVGEGLEVYKIAGDLKKLSKWNIAFRIFFRKNKNRTNKSIVI